MRGECGLAGGGGHLLVGVTLPRRALVPLALTAMRNKLLTHPTITLPRCMHARTHAHARARARARTLINAHRFIVSGDDAGVVCQWSVVGGMARGTAPSALLARHDKGEGSPVTALCIVCGGVAAAVAYADGRLRVFLLGSAAQPGSGGGGAAPTAAAAAACGRALELEVTAHVGAVTALAVHPRLPCFATAGQDGVVNVWSLPELARGSSSSSGSSSGSCAAGSATPTLPPPSTVGRLVLDMSTKVSNSVMLTGLSFSPAVGSPGQYHLLAAGYDCSSVRIFLS
jgi:hypothetical protein